MDTIPEGTDLGDIVVVVVAVVAVVDIHPEDIIPMDTVVVTTVGDRLVVEQLLRRTIEDRLGLELDKLPEPMLDIVLAEHNLKHTQLEVQQQVGNSAGQHKLQAITEPIVASIVAFLLVASDIELWLLFAFQVEGQQLELLPL